jgi:hypothetical protein
VTHPQNSSEIRSSTQTHFNPKNGTFVGKIGRPGTLEAKNGFFVAENSNFRQKTQKIAGVGGGFISVTDYGGFEKSDFGFRGQASPRGGS